MKLHPLFAAGALLALAACQPLAAEYTEAEVPKQITLDSASGAVAVGFVRGSSRLLLADAARLRSLAASGGLASSDRISVALRGTPALAAERFATIANLLVPYGITVNEITVPAVGPNRAIVSAERYLVTLPKCPAWSQKGSLDFTNASPSNFGCAIAVDLGLSIARPADLAEGTPVGMPDGRTAASAVNRYLNDKVTLPIEANVSPITAAPAALPTGGENLATSPE
jgi:type IV pilus biogenesis protein CpaD/CtpE